MANYCRAVIKSARGTPFLLHLTRNGVLNLSTFPERGDSYPFGSYPKLDHYLCRQFGRTGRSLYFLHITTITILWAFAKNMGISIPQALSLDRWILILFTFTQKKGSKYFRNLLGSWDPNPLDI
jgi:hypothetical protein